MWKALYGKGFNRLPRAERIGVIGVWVGLLGGIASTLGFIGGIWAVRSSESIANRSGAFDKAQISVLVGGNRLTPGLRANLVYGLPFESKSAAIVDIPIIVVNAGKRAAKGLSLTLRCPTFVTITDDAHGEVVTTGTLPMTRQPERHITPAGNSSYIIWSLPEMNPGVALALDEPVMLKETAIEGAAQTKDGAMVGYRVEYALDVMISVSSEDEAVVDYPLMISAWKVANAEAMIREFFRRMQLLARDTRRQNSWWQYFRVALKAQDQPYSLVVPRFERIVDPDDGTVVLFASQKNYDQQNITYNPFSFWFVLLVPK
jgi:hypothetical protein